MESSSNSLLLEGKKLMSVHRNDDPPEEPEYADPYEWSHLCRGNSNRSHKGIGPGKESFYHANNQEVLWSIASALWLIAGELECQGNIKRRKEKERDK